MVCVLCAGAADAALVRFGNLILTADGGFTPRLLPKRAFAPIEFEGHADLRAVDGGIPPAVRQIVLDFDRDGRLSTGGLPICAPAVLEEATPAEARARCPGAVVGSGRVEALVALGDGPPVKVGSPLTVFNGPRQEGHATAILHARTTAPSVQAFVLTVPIERRGGDFRYRATIDVPPIAGGQGSLTHVDGTIGRRYRFEGTRRSYASARCSDGVLRTHGRLTFADTTIIDGTIEKACTAR
ncbi:MAG TPA: hypothetical protein VF093_06075 [Solirubrobacterales bacterium]